VDANFAAFPFSAHSDFEHECQLHCMSAPWATFFFILPFSVLTMYPDRCYGLFI
jgi:hypothetical protein